MLEIQLNSDALSEARRNLGHHVSDIKLNLTSIFQNAESKLVMISREIIESFTTIEMAPMFTPSLNLDNGNRQEVAISLEGVNCLKGTKLLRRGLILIAIGNGLQAVNQSHCFLGKNGQVDLKK